MNTGLRFLSFVLGLHFAALSNVGDAVAQETPARQKEEKKPADAKKDKPTLPKSWVDKMRWRGIGPANMSGRIVDLAFNEKDPCMYWVATASGGLLKTTNAGVTYEHQFDREKTVSIGSVAVAASNPDIVWVGTGEANPRNSVSWGDGVYKSTDGGKTWKNMGLRESFQIGGIAIHPENPDTVYVGALGRLWGPSEQRGLFKTIDGGKTWKKVLYVDDKTGVIDFQMKPGDPETLIVCTYERQRDGYDTNDPVKKWGPGSGLYKTTDGGASFRKLTAGLPTCLLGRIGIDFYRSNPEVIYAVIETENITQEPENAAYMGITGADADVGARITQVVKDGPAARAKIQVGDVIFRVENSIVHSYRDLLREIRKRLAGETVQMELSRGRKSEKVEVNFTMRPSNREDPDREGPEGAEAKATAEKTAPKEAAPKKDPPKKTQGEAKATPEKAGEEKAGEETKRKRKGKKKKSEKEETQRKEGEEAAKPEEAEKAAGKTDPPEKEEKKPVSQRDKKSGPFSGGLGGQRENVQEEQGPAGHEFGGVYVSEDGGETWRRINSVNPRPMYYSADPRGSERFRTYIYRARHVALPFQGRRRDLHG